MNLAMCLLITLSGFGTLPGLEPEMIYVPGGTFKMGSTAGAGDEKPVHQVSLGSFYIGKYEVTQKEWREVMGNDINVNYFPGCDSCPVERVSWISIMEFLRRLNEMTGLNYRLPTEAEWEFAARGGPGSKGYKYSGSSDIDAVAWRDGNSDMHTHPVGLKKPNELGIFDMSGNVWEWCSDWYSPDYYSASPVNSPTGPEEGKYRVMRGGSWYHDLSGLKVSDRDSGEPEWRYGYVGFRLCR
jgi:formylglycine-generating enzyme required for sulfatase activity